MAERYTAAYAGIYRATVVQAPAGATGTWVIVPRLNGNQPMGPVQGILSPVAHDTLPAGTGPHTHSLDRQYKVGTRVLVGTIAGVKDDLVILGGLP